MKRRSTYTEHKLTDAMLRRLSAIAGGRYAGGNSVGALESRGLVFDAAAGFARAEFVITDAGRLALANARKEGW
jgi:hypothetical protein